MSLDSYLLIDAREPVPSENDDNANFPPLQPGSYCLQLHQHPQHHHRLVFAVKFSLNRGSKHHIQQ